MLTEAQVREIVMGHIEQQGHFLVDVQVRPGNIVELEVDNDKAIRISELAEINRAVRADLEALGEDVELRVSSPGMGKPFKVHRQYHKHLGRLVTVDTSAGKKLEGILHKVSDKGIAIRLQHPSKIKGRKPKIDEEAVMLDFDEISTTKASITFK